MVWEEVLHSQETLPAILARMAERSPDQAYVHNVDGAITTWGQLQLSVEAWAARFIGLGVKKGDVVTTFLEANPESLAIWLGLSKIGAIDAATNTEFRGRILAYAINNTGSSLILVAQRFLPILESVAEDLQTINRVLIIDANELPGVASRLPNLSSLQSTSFDVASARRHFIVPQWHDIACITYTSGTTGPSKAVRMPWGQLNCVNLGTFPFKDLAASDIFYCTISHAHFGARTIPYHAAMVGGQVAIRPRFSLQNFWSDVERFGITTGMLVGTMADMLLNSPDCPSGTTSLRNVFLAPLGGSYREFSKRFGVRICTAYNSTEGGLAVCSDWNPTNERTVGRLRKGYPGFEVRIVDENDIEVPDGAPGEVIIRSSVPWTMNAGYLNSPGATAKAWQNGWFHTGDALLRTGDGDYIFVDRLKDVIRRRGENISSYEVETDVLRHQDVLECAAVAVPADTQEDEILLFVVRRAESTLTQQSLCADLAGRMTRFMVPRYVEFVDSLPKTQATARIIKSELRQRGLGPETWDNEKQCYVAAKVKQPA